MMVMMMTNCWSKVVGPVNWFSQQAGDDDDDEGDDHDIDENGEDDCVVFLR